MPMFDDPKKELQRLQQELLAEEESFEEAYFDEDEWLDQEIAEAKALSGYQEPQPQPVRNYANGYGARPQNPYQRPAQPYETQQRRYLSGYSTYQESRPGYRPDVRGYHEEEIEEYEEEKGIRGLVILACMLTLGIVAVAMYWVLVLL